MSFHVVTVSDDKEYCECQYPLRAETIAKSLTQYLKQDTLVYVSDVDTLTVSEQSRFTLTPEGTVVQVPPEYLTR